MSDRIKDMQGVQVSKEEVLNDLGNPADWAQGERKLEFQHRLVPGNKQLNIFGIKGCPGREGYLDYLKRSLKNPLGSDTGLVSEEENQKIRETATREISIEIEKYTALLAKLETRPTEVDKYLCDLRRAIEITKMFGSGLPEIQRTEELQELVRETDAENARNIIEIEKTILEYTEILNKIFKDAGVY